MRICSLIESSIAISHRSHTSSWHPSVAGKSYATLFVIGSHGGMHQITRERVYMRLHNVHRYGIWVITYLRFCHADTYMLNVSLIWLVTARTFLKFLSRVAKTWSWTHKKGVVWRMSQPLWRGSMERLYQRDEIRFQYAPGCNSNSDLQHQLVVDRLHMFTVVTYHRTWQLQRGRMISSLYISMSGDELWTCILITLRSNC